MAQVLCNFLDIVVKSNVTEKAKVKVESCTLLTTACIHMYMVERHQNSNDGTSPGLSIKMITVAAGVWGMVEYQLWASGSLVEPAGNT